VKRLSILAAFLCFPAFAAAQAPSEAQLAKWLKQYPKADANRDGKLTVQEAIAFRDKMQGGGNAQRRRGPKREFKVDPGWNAERFPEHAKCYCTPEELRALHPEVASFEKPTDGAMRIVGTGHSFMVPGYKALPAICRAAGFEQPLHTHTGGGMTGSARYKWEEENGIFGFEGKARPKLLTSIANAEWDAMMWGPYFNDRPEYYTCWIDFCLKHHPHMKFYLSDAWPSIQQLDTVPNSEAELTLELFTRLAKQQQVPYVKIMESLNGKYPGKVFIIPTSAAMVLAVKHFHLDELPGIEGIHRAVGKKERSLWRDPLGHLGPGFDRLEGYVFYATLYGKSPELIDEEVAFGGGDGGLYSPELDQKFRNIAWQAVLANPFSGITDKDGDGVADTAK
jgi:hypothetical protein